MPGAVGEDLHEVHGPHGDQTGQVRKPGPGKWTSRGLPAVALNVSVSLC